MTNAYVCNCLLDNYILQSSTWVKYVTIDIARKLVEPKTTGIKRITVASSNIASVGYDAEKEIEKI